MSQKVIKTVLAAALAGSGTLTLSYPAGSNAGTFINGVKHKVVTGSNDSFPAPKYFTLSFGSSSITLTWDSAAPTLPVGTVLYINLDESGAEYLPTTVHNSRDVALKLIVLGAPITADADGVSVSQSVGAAANFTITGALASGGVATFDAPRNVVAAWTGTAVLTITGKDEYGNTVVEQSASGTSHTGKKAFKTVTSVVSSASITAATVGSGVVLGLPVFLPSATSIIKENMDNAAATAGTTVAGKIGAKQSATTGDVRGTYSPNTAPDGSHYYSLLLALPDPDFLGDAQYAG